MPCFTFHAMFSKNSDSFTGLPSMPVSTHSTCKDSMKGCTDLSVVGMVTKPNWAANAHIPWLCFSRLFNYLMLEVMKVLYLPKAQLWHWKDS